MKLLTPPTEILQTNVKSIFLNPYHYIYVIQKQDNYVYLYDQMTLDFIGKTRTTFPQTFKIFTFTDNFNVFCTFIQNKPSQQSQIIVFNLQPQGIINAHRYGLTRNKIPQNITLFGISFIQKQKQKDKDKQRYIVGLNRNRIYYISLSGEIIKDIQIRKDGRELNLINGFCIRQNRWIFVQTKQIYFASIVCEQYRIDDSMPMQSVITSIFLDASVRSQFMAFITQLHTVIIMSRFGQKWRITHRFKVPNLTIRKICFLYPGVNTSTTNRYKDKVYLLMHGDMIKDYDDQFIDIEQYTHERGKILKCLIPKECLEDGALYIHQYSIQELMEGKRELAPKFRYWVRKIGMVKYTIWANEHAQNCIRIFNQQKMVQSINLISLLQGLYIGKEWVCLGYRFQPKTANVLYEETEDNFEKERKEYRHIKEEELNDWSYSLFTKQALVKKTIKRLNCLQF